MKKPSEKEINQVLETIAKEVGYIEQQKEIRMKFRTEREMMLELALVAEREDATFKLFNLSLVLCKTSYRAYCLDIHYLADGRKDKVVKLVANTNPNQPALYCLLSELPASL